MKSFLKTVFYVLEYVFLYPILSVVWLFFFTLILSIMAPGVTVKRRLLLSMAVVSSIRITSYYDELLSQDLVKMIPFALLGVFLVEGSLRTSSIEVISKGREF